MSGAANICCGGASSLLVTPSRCSTRANRKRIANSIALEMDTWYNPQRGDFLVDHIAIHSRGGEENRAAGRSSSVSGGRRNNATYDFTSVSGGKSTNSSSSTLAPPRQKTGAEGEGLARSFPRKVDLIERARSRVIRPVRGISAVTAVCAHPPTTAAKRKASRLAAR